MIPGVGKMMKNVDLDDNSFVGVESIIQSMTPAELSLIHISEPTRPY